MAFLAGMLGAGASAFGTAMGALKGATALAGAASTAVGTVESAVSGVGSLAGTIGKVFGQRGATRAVPGLDPASVKKLTDINDAVTGVTSQLHHVAKENERREAVQKAFAKEMRTMGDHLLEGQQTIEAGLRGLAAGQDAVQASLNEGFASIRNGQSHILDKVAEVKVDIAEVKERISLIGEQARVNKNAVMRVSQGGTVLQLGADLNARLGAVTQRLMSIKRMRSSLEDGDGDKAWEFAQELNDLIAACIPPSNAAPGAGNYWVDYAKHIAARYQEIQDTKGKYINVLSDEGKDFLQSLIVDSNYFVYFVSVLHEAIEEMLNLATVNNGKIRAEKSDNLNDEARKTVYQFAQDNLLALAQNLHPVNPKRSPVFQSICQRLLSQRVVVSFGKAATKEYYFPIHSQLKVLLAEVKADQQFLKGGIGGKRGIAENEDDVSDLTPLMTTPDVRIPATTNGDTVHYKIALELEAVDSEELQKLQSSLDAQKKALEDQLAAQKQNSEADLAAQKKELQDKIDALESQISQKHDEVAKHKVALDIKVRRAESLDSRVIGSFDKGVKVRVIKTSGVRALIDPGPCWVTTKLSDDTALLDLA